MVRSWLGCLFGILIPSIVFYLYLLLNGKFKCDIIIDLSLALRTLRCYLLVPSTEIDKSNIGGKSQSLSIKEGSNLLENHSLERSRLINNFEVCLCKLHFH